MKLHLVRLGAGVLNAVGADALIGWRHMGVGAIFVLHSVVKDRRYFLYDQLTTSAKLLENLLTFYASRDIDVVGLDEALYRLENGSRRFFVTFTFDDGFRDNMKVVLPIFQRFDKPFTVYVTTAFVRRSFCYWWGALRELIKSNASVSLEVLDVCLPTSTLEEKVRAYRLIKRKIAAEAIDGTLVADLCRAQGISTEDILEREALSEREVFNLSRYPLVEIGGHTDSHPHLSHLAPNEVRQEMASNKQFLENLTGREVKHFAYPYGGSMSCGVREFKIAREVGFRSATTTRIGGLFREHLSHLTSLPRLRMLSSFESLRLIECERRGLVSAVANRFARPPVTA